MKVYLLYDTSTLDAAYVLVAVCSSWEIAENIMHDKGNSCFYIRQVDLDTKFYV